MSKSRCLIGASSAALIVSGMLLSVPLTGWAQIEEIVVSTRRKEESVQDVPIAVDAISAEQIARQGIGNLADVTKLSTSVQFDQSFGPSDVRIAIRGLSNTRGRSNVAFLVDNVDTTTENFVSAGSGLLANQRLLVDVERIEIVKGPQSALFGRAAFAGAISYTTKDPGDEFDGEVRLTAGDAGLFEVGGALGGPVAGLENVLGIRVSGAYWTEDGFYTNTVSGNNVGGEEGWGTALTALFTPADNVELKWRTEYSDSKYDQRANIRVGGGTDGTGLVFYPYPIDPALIQAESDTQTKLADFGQYCPDDIKAQLAAAGETRPGICQNAGYGNGGGQRPTLSEDPVTGQDYRGTDTQLLRSTLNASIDFDFGTFSSITGFTDYDAFDELDQDYQAVGRPDMLKAHQQGRSDLETSQYSQELRFASSWEGPFQATLGALYWKEERKQEDLNFIISCIENGKNVGTGEVWPGASVSGICDGTNGSISGWQEQALQQFPCLYANGVPVPDPATGKCVQASRTPAPWRADTEHKSAYFKLAFDLSDTWTVEFENRFVWEDFNLLRPNFSSCSRLFFPFGLSVSSSGTKEVAVTAPGFEDKACTSELHMNPNLSPPNPSSPDPDAAWALIQGSEKSSYNTPKITSRWQATDDMQVYMSWGIGQKPGGINTLSSGGTATTIEAERFASEEVTAWEIGMKSDWEVAGFLRFNAALFLNDYTDKQVGTQVSKDQNGALVLQPRIVNAAGAQVWGTELEAIWQPSFADGLVLSANYTYQRAEYTNFEDDTRNVVRAAFNGSCDLIYRDTVENADGEFPVVPVPTAPDWNPRDRDSYIKYRANPYCRLDLSGNQLERVPEHAFVGSAQFTQSLLDTGVDYFLELTGKYQGERYLDSDNNAKFDDYVLVDARAGLTQDNWEFLVYVDNLFDDDTIQTGGSGPDFAKQVTQLGFSAGLGSSHFFAVLPDPRTFGAKLTMRF